MLTLQLLLVTVFCACASANLHTREFYEEKFFDHARIFGLEFEDSNEFVRRIQIFSDNFDHIEQHNLGNHTYRLGLNAFSHLTFAEFKEAINLVDRKSYSKSSDSHSGSGIHLAPGVEASSNPTSVDWVSNGAVTGVKYQGFCGACWAFSATGAIEGAYYIKHKTLKSFSEQQLVSCDTVGQLGCSGGYVDRAFDYVQRAGGLATEQDYPYSSATGSNSHCKFDYGYDIPLDPLAAPASYTNVQPKSIAALESAVAQQPVSLYIDADEADFQHYSSGVYNGPCGNNLNHGVLAVGYGVDSGSAFWKVKNSWGTSWGENGYIRIEKSSADVCGVLDEPRYPNL